MVEFLKYNNFDYVFKTPEKVEGKMPVIVFLHGAGTRGTSLQTLSHNAFFRQSSWYGKPDCPALIFAPLCMKNSWFDVFEQLQEFVKYALSHPNADADRLYFIGTSMGGYGVWQLAMTMSEYVAALFPVCGGGMTWNSKTLAHIPIWTVHGAADIAVSPADSIRFVEKIKAREGEAHITLLEGVGHNCWDYAFANREIYDWLFSKTRKAKIDDGIDEYADAKKFG